jgi:hypothetical protein
MDGKPELASESSGEKVVARRNNIQVSRKVKMSDEQKHQDQIVVFGDRGEPQKPLSAFKGL